MSKSHILQSKHSNFSISHHLQQILCLIGQSKVYSEASEIINELLNIDVSAMQIQRVCKYYGQVVDELIDKNIIDYIPRLEHAKKDDDIYVMVDGSMLYTRDENWKEVKLGRIFSGSQIIPLTAKRSEIVESVYVSHMGSVHEFFPKLERHLTGYSNKVIIGDGAAWIWNWAEDNYPNAIQILDFFHAKEKLVLFSNQQFSKQDKKEEWLDRQLERLRDDQVEQVITEIQTIRSRNTGAKEFKQKLIRYFLEHEDRMYYKTYRDKGLLIGSGPIEAAHRSVLQQRMKLSGQKWTRSGANAIANLRCYKKSGAWNIIKNIIHAA